MPNAKAVDQVRSKLDKLRKDALDMVVSANKIVYKGVQRVADHELKTLNDTYRSTVSSLRKVRSSDSIKDAAGRQIDLLQETATRLIESARDAIAIIGETRAELNKLMRKDLRGVKVDVADAEKLAGRARRAVEEVRDTAVETIGATAATSGEKPKRRIGRPRKNTAATAAATGSKRATAKTTRKTASKSTSKPTATTGRKAAGRKTAAASKSTANKPAAARKSATSKRAPKPKKSGSVASAAGSAPSSSTATPPASGNGSGQN